MTKQANAEAAPQEPPNAPAENVEKVLQSKTQKATVSARLKVDVKVTTRIAQAADGTMPLACLVVPDETAGETLKAAVLRAIRRDLKPQGATAQALRGEVTAEDLLPWPKTFTCKLGI